jgi:hypothetical protein
MCVIVLTGCLIVMILGCGVEFGCSSVYPYGRMCPTMGGDGMKAQPVDGDHVVLAACMLCWEVLAGLTVLAASMLRCGAAVHGLLHGWVLVCVPVVLSQ